MSSFFDEIDGAITIATYGFKPQQKATTLPLGTQIEDILTWITSHDYDSVILLTNQSGLKRDLALGKALQRISINAIFQGEKAARLGHDKTRMKNFFQRNGFRTPEFEIVASVMEAINFAKHIGYPAILKTSNLSDGRKMALVMSDEDIEEYFYENAIAEPIIMERFISGREVSTIVYSQMNKHIVFPVVFKPKTDYLLLGRSMRGRTYISPHEAISTVERDVQDLALRVSHAVANRYFLGLDIVLDVNNIPYILEFNARITETLRMSMILTKVNVFKMMCERVGLPPELETYLKPHGFVIDVPCAQIKREELKKRRGEDKIFVTFSNARATLQGNSLEELLREAAVIHPPVLEETT